MPNNLRAYRHAAGLTVAKLAELSGVPYRSIQDYEAEKMQLVNVHVLRRLVAVLGCTIDDLVPPTD